MPVFMDLHISDTGRISVEELIKIHQSDPAMQRKHEVNFKYIWLNQEKGVVLYLMNGPDKDTCTLVHQHAYRDQGCNIFEINPEDCNKFLSGSLMKRPGADDTKSVTFDSGFRTLLRFKAVLSKGNGNSDLSEFIQVIRRYGGVLLANPYRAVEAVFTHTSEAFYCAEALKNDIEHKCPGVDYRISLVSGNLFGGKEQEFYTYATDLAEKLSISGKPGSIRSNRLTKVLLYWEIGDKLPAFNGVQFVSENDEIFLNTLFKLIRDNFRDPGFSTSDLLGSLPISRSQLFRRCKRTANFTPNILIKEIRLLEVLKELESSSDPIYEIAYRSGFSSHSYFTKVFKQRFNVSPSAYMKDKPSQ